MFDGAVLTSVTSSTASPTCFSRPDDVRLAAGAAGDADLLALELGRSPAGTPASARAITDSTSLCGFLSALFQVCPISTTGTPRDTAVRNG